MKPAAIILFLPALVLISLLGFGAGTALAHNGQGALDADSAQGFSDLSATQISPGPHNGATGPASTHAATGTKRKAFVGTVDSITGANVDGVTGSWVDLTLNGTGLMQPVYVYEDYQFKTPGGKRAGTFDVGAEVVMLAELHDYYWVAIGGVVKPKPKKPLLAVVVDQEEDLVPAVTPEGDIETFTLPDDVGDVTPGEVVIVFEDESGEVTGLVSADDIQERLDEFLEEATTEEGEAASAEETELRSRRLQAIVEAHGRFGEDHLRILYQVEDRVPEHAKSHIANMMAKVEAKRQNSRAALERVKAMLWEKDQFGNASAHEDRRPEARGEQPEKAEVEDRIRGKSSGEEDTSGAGDSKRPVTPAGPRVVDDGADGDDSDVPVDDPRRGSGAKGRNK